MKRKTSSTAGYTCFTRACAAEENDIRFRGADDMAHIFLPAFASLILNVPVLRKAFMHKVAPAGIYEYVIARTRIFDELFLSALKNNFQQIVLMGAGMDTRALRFARHNKGTRIFELDLPKTQQPKREILERKRVALPDELVFVPIDFNKQDIAVVLAQAGYQAKQKTLFLWEGLSMYLDAQAVDCMLAFIRESGGVGSMLGFDYIYASVLKKENSCYGEEDIHATVSAAGEGWTFGIAESEITDYLSARGFKLEDHFTPAEMEKKYLTADDGSLFGRINGTHCIASALLATKGRKV